MKLEDMLGDYKSMVAKWGWPVGLDTEQCKKWKKKHENCCNCPTEIGCTKVVSLGLLVLSGKADVTKQLDEIYNAKTRQELLKVDLEPAFDCDW